MSDAKDDGGASKQQSVPERVKEAWLGIMGVFTSAEQKVMEAFGLNPNAPLGEEIARRMRENRAEFERRLDEGVKAAVARIRAPVDKEIAAMKGRVEKIQQRIEEQKKKRASKKA